MSKLRHVGLDVHKDSIVMAVADSGSSPAVIVARFEWSESRVLSELRKLGPLGSLKVCYEAGPTGYGLQRYLAAHKVDCVVIAPALVPQLQGCHIKTDRRDACKLAHFLRSGDLTQVWIPDEQTEALRDLVRARDDARLAERGIRQQLLKFLLRQGRHVPRGSTIGRRRTGPGSASSNSRPKPSDASWPMPFRRRKPQPRESSGWMQTWRSVSPTGSRLHW